MTEICCFELVLSDNLSLDARRNYDWKLAARLALLGVSRKKAGNYELRAETIGFQQFVKIATLQIGADEN